MTKEEDDRLIELSDLNKERKRYESKFNASSKS